MTLTRILIHDTLLTFDRHCLMNLEIVAKQMRSQTRIRNSIQNDLSLKKADSRYCYFFLLVNGVTSLPYLGYDRDCWHTNAPREPFLKTRQLKIGVSLFNLATTNKAKSSAVQISNEEKSRMALPLTLAARHFRTALLSFLCLGSSRVRDDLSIGSNNTKWTSWTDWSWGARTDGCKIRKRSMPARGF